MELGELSEPRLSRALSAVSQVWGRTGLKTRVMNNLLATFCLHFTRTIWISDRQTTDANRLTPCACARG